MKPTSAPSMPISYRKYEGLSDTDFKAIRTKARMLALGSDEALNFVVETARRGSYNDLTAFLEYLSRLR
jgi:hypothetical protein